METRKVRAISGFTAFTGTMQVFNAAKRDADGKIIAPATEGELPAAMAADYVTAGIAEYVDAESGEVPAHGELSAPITGDGSGEALPPIESPFTMTHKGFGEYLIEGPGIAPDTVIKGKSDAQTFIAQAEKAHAEAEAALAIAPENQKTIEPRELAEGEMLEEGEGGPEGEPIDAPGAEDDAPVD